MSNTDGMIVEAPSILSKDNFIVTGNDSGFDNETREHIEL